MADHDVTTLWTDSDDDALRLALLSLRADAETVGMPDPAFIRGRGTSARRRRYAGWTAGLVASTAAVAVVVTVSGVLGGHDTPTLPGGSSATSSSSGPGGTSGTSSSSGSSSGSTVAADPLATGGILPVATDWQHAAGLASAPTIEGQPTEGFTDLCSLYFGASLDVDDRVVADPAHPDDTYIGQQRSFAYPNTTNAAADAKAAHNSVNTNCPGSHTLTAVAASALPAGAWAWKVVLDGKTGWLGFAQKNAGITYLEVSPINVGADKVTQSRFAALLATAIARIDRYGVPSTKTAGP